MDFRSAKYLVVGAGFFGAVLAERIANDLNEDVVIIDKRDHIAGNCLSLMCDDSEIEYHKYGSHIFHTTDELVWNYINKFCSFSSYQHMVLTQYNDRVYQMPINLHTINSYYNLNLKPYEAETFIINEIKKENITNPKNLEEKAISLIGRPLYEAFIRGYTIKQWQTDPINLPENIITRLPVRYNHNYNYFNDPWQGMPLNGYTDIFTNMFNNNKIHIHLNTDFFDIINNLSEDCRIIYTGPIDQYFDYKYGKLGWRTLRFEDEVIDVTDYQGTSVMNYADETIPYTRIHEFKHLHPERQYPDGKTYIFKEYSLNVDSIYNEPYYPINTEKDKQVLAQYQNEAKSIQNIIFGGRLGSYKYLDMDKTIALALKTYDEKIKNPCC